MRKAGKLFRLISKLVDERPREVRRGLDRDERVVNERTRGKYSRQIGRGTQAARKYLDKRHRRGH